MFEQRVDSYFHLSTDPFDRRLLGSLLWPGWHVSRYWSDISDIETETRVIADGLKAKKSGTGRVEQESIESCARAMAEARLQKEQVFECVRKAEFPASPSRQYCMFLCESEAELREYIAQYGLPTIQRRIVEIEPFVDSKNLPDEAAHKNIAKDLHERLIQCRRQRANQRFLNCNGFPASEQEEMARRYWRSEDTGVGTLTEVLFFGFFRLVRVIEP